MPPKHTHTHNIIVLLSAAVFSLYESTQWTTREHNAYCCWLPIMMHNPVAAQEYNTNMSGLWFGHNLHGYNSLSTGSRLSRARRLHYNDWPCASDSLFQASVAQSPGPLSRQYPILIPLSASRQSLHKHVCPPLPTSSPPPPPSPPTQCFFLFFKLFLYHTSISHGDQYRCNSLGLPKSACLQAFARITAIDPSRFGPVPTLFNVCAAAQQASSRSRHKLFEIKIMDFVWNKVK